MTRPLFVVGADSPVYQQGRLFEEPRAPRTPFAASRPGAAGAEAPVWVGPIFHIDENSKWTMEWLAKGPTTVVDRLFLEEMVKDHNELINLRNEKKRRFKVCSRCLSG